MTTSWTESPEAGMCGGPATGWAALPPSGMSGRPPARSSWPLNGVTFACPEGTAVGDAVEVDGRPAVVRARWQEEDCGGWPTPVAYATYT